MHKADIAIAVVLVVAIAGSVVGVVTYDDARIATFDVAWSTQESEVLVAEDTTSGGAIEIPFEVSQTNMTGLHLDVTVSSAAPRLAPVSVLVELVPPAGLNATSQEAEIPVGAAAGTVSVALEVSLSELPDVTTLTAASPDAARERLSQTANSTVGVGTWTLRVNVASTAPGGVGGAPTATVEAVGVATWYEAEVRVQTPEVRG